MQTQIKNHEKTIADLKKPNEEIMNELKQKIKQKWQELGLSNSDLEKSLQEAQTYQRLVDLEQKTFATKWQESQLLLRIANKDKVNLKVGLIASVIVISVIVLGGLSYWLLRKERVKRKRNL